VVREKPKGMVAFTVIWSGQIISLLGTSMAGFALLFWVWIETEQATAAVLLGFFQFVPLLIMTPVAGALVDRWNRKKAMIISDLAAGIGSVVILLLYVFGVLEVWHLYVVGIFIGIFAAFQWPAFSAAITLLVDKKHYARADGMLGLAGSLSLILGPPIAAVLLAVIDISGILVVDIVTFSYAIGVLLLMHIPQPSATEEEKDMKSIWKDSMFGFRYIFDRKPFFLLAMTFFAYNLLSTFGVNVFAPMVLARTGNDAGILGGVMSVLGIAGLIGGVVLAIWGGPKRRINGLLGGMMISVIGGAAVLPLNPYIWALGAFLFMFAVPISIGCSQAIWQSKVPPQLQGRVFGARRFIAQISSVFGFILVGPLADFVFEPAMMPGGWMAEALGSVVPPGPGAGMAVIIFISFTLCTFVSIVAYMSPKIRNIEDIVPDHDVKEEYNSAETQ
jgi:MFS family permease